MDERNCGYCKPCAEGDYDNCETFPEVRETNQLRTQVEALTKQLAKAEVIIADKNDELKHIALTLAAYEAEPVAGWTGKDCGVISNADRDAMFPCRNGIEGVGAAMVAAIHCEPLIRKPTSTEHVDARINAAVEKERDECLFAVPAKKFNYEGDTELTTSEKQGWNMACDAILEAIRARKGE